MLRAILILILAIASPIASGEEQPSTKLEPGLWRLLVRSDQDGRPAPDKTENRCYSAEEFGDVVATFTKQTGNMQNCILKHNVMGKTLTGSMTCETPVPTGGVVGFVANITYVFEDAKLFTGNSRMVFTPPDHPPMTLSMRIVGRHIGSCPN